MNKIPDVLKDKVMSAAQAASLIKSGMCLGFSGFTLVGYPSEVPKEIARQKTAKNLTVLTGASVGDALDGELARAGLIKYRAPYQSAKDLRTLINNGAVYYNDFHLSHLPRQINLGWGPHIDYAIVEAALVTDQGIIPTGSVGATDCFIKNADKVIVEVNIKAPDDFAGMHDIFEAKDDCIPIRRPADRVGTDFIPCKMDKIAAVVFSQGSGQYPAYKKQDDISIKISENIVDFLKQEVKAGRQPESLRPIQSGVGNVANAVLAGLGKEFTNLSMYTEVLQDSAFRLITEGIIDQASTTSIALSESSTEELYRNFAYYKKRIVIRPQEIANNPEVIRRLGVISLNTPIEADIYGNINSTHVMGSMIMNGIGGSGDFARNAGLTIFATGSLAKNGAISCIVPMVSHVDHTEHDVDVIVTEYGVADLRWKTPRERAKLIIDNCAHPDYRQALKNYFEEACNETGGQTPHILSKAFSWHARYLNTGTMMP